MTAYNLEEAESVIWSLDRAEGASYVVPSCAPFVFKLWNF